MFLNDLLETGVIQLDESGEIIDLCGYLVEILLQHHELFIGRGIIVLGGAAICCSRPPILQSLHNIVDILVRALDATGYLNELELLLRKDLLELLFYAGDEFALVLLGPFLSLRFRVLFGGTGDIIFLHELLQVIVGNVVPFVLVDDARAELLAELHDDDAGLDAVRAAGGGLGEPGTFLRLKVLDN